MRKDIKKSEEPHHKTYILTCDWGNKVRRLNYCGIITPPSSDSFFAETQKALFELLGNIFAKGVNIQAISMDNLSEEILSRAMRMSTFLKDGYVVSTCPEIAVGRGGHTLEINRIIDQSGQIIGFGPRPGHSSIEDQISGIAAEANGRPIILVEDGSFTGGTMTYVLDKLIARQIRVGAIVIGFAFPKAMENLRQHFNGEIHVVEQMDDLVDWMPDHDFFPFTPNCGRIVGVSWNGSALPFYTHNGATYTVPYIMPFGPINQWASIPKDRAAEFSLYCLQRDLELFCLLEQMNRKIITIADIVDTHPKVSVPISIGQNRLPSLDTRVIDFLVETCHELV